VLFRIQKCDGIGSLPCCHQQLGADGPQEIAMLSSCEVGQDRRTFLTEFEIFSTSIISIYMEEEIRRDLSHYVRTSSSTLGPTGPAAVPVLAMDVNPYPDVNCDSVRLYVL